MKQGDSGNKEDKRCRTVRNKRPFDRPCESYCKKNITSYKKKKNRKKLKNKNK